MRELYQSEFLLKVFLRSEEGFLEYMEQMEDQKQHEILSRFQEQKKDLDDW